MSPGTAPDEGEREGGTEEEHGIEWRELLNLIPRNRSQRLGHQGGFGTSEKIPSRGGEEEAEGFAEANDLHFDGGGFARANAAEEPTVSL